MPDRIADPRGVLRERLQSIAVLAVRAQGPAVDDDQIANLLDDIAHDTQVATDCISQILSDAE